MKNPPAQPDEMRMSTKEFDRIMGQALRVKPQDAKATKQQTSTKRRSKKAKSARK